MLVSLHACALGARAPAHGPQAMVPEQVSHCVSTAVNLKSAWCDTACASAELKCPAACLCVAVPGNSVRFARLSQTILMRLARKLRNTPAADRSTEMETAKAESSLSSPPCFILTLHSVCVVDLTTGENITHRCYLSTNLERNEYARVIRRRPCTQAKEMTKASLQELLLTREQLSEANQKLEHYERNVQTVISSMQGQADRKQAR